jgi:hypothetical protein
MPKHVDRQYDDPEPDWPGATPDEINLKRIVRRATASGGSQEYQCIKCGSVWWITGWSTRAGFPRLTDAEQVRRRKEEECPG